MNDIGPVSLRAVVGAATVAEGRDSAGHETERSSLPGAAQDEPQRELRRRKPGAVWRFALQRLTRHKGPLAMALFWSVIFILVPMQVPVITGALIDSMRGRHAHLYGLKLDPASRRQSVKIAGLALMVVAAVHGLSAYLRQLSINKLTRRFVGETRQELMARLTMMPLERHFEFGSAELFHRVIVDTATLRGFTGQVVIRTATNVLRVAFPAVLLFLRAPWLAAIVCTPVLLQWAIGNHLQKRTHRARLQARRTRVRFTTLVKEQLDGIETIQGLGAGQEALRRTVCEAEQLEREQLDQADCSGKKAAVIWAMTSLGFALAWGLGGLQVQRGQMTIGQLVSFAGLLTFVYSPFRRFAGAMGTSRKILLSLGHVQELLELPADPAEVPGTQTLEGIEGRIELRNVSFAYSSEAVLKNVMLTIPPRSLTAITGHSGSGKTTLLRLINRLYDPQQGQVLIDGACVRQFSVTSLRSSVVLVPQRPVVFSGTIAENLRLSRPEASEAELLEACEAAELLAFVQRQKQGLQTRLGQGGAQLSGGEAQRLAIARAVLMRPKILLLDEPTSALDLRCQAAIMKTLGRLKARMTVVVVGHRLEAFGDADRLVVLDKGRVVEYGQPDELHSCRDFYSSLFGLKVNGHEHSLPCSTQPT